MIKHGDDLAGNFLKTRLIGREGSIRFGIISVYNFNTVCMAIY